jgi:hypothetical protein
MNVTPDLRDHFGHAGPQRAEDSAECRDTALKTAWCPDAEECSHPEPEIEGTRMDEQPLVHVFVAADVHAPEPTGLVKVRTRSLD